MEKKPAKIKEKHHMERLPISNIPCISSPLNIMWLEFIFKSMIPLMIRSEIVLRVHGLLLGKIH